MNIVDKVENNVINVLRIYSRYRKALIAEFLNLTIQPAISAPAGRDRLKRELEIIRGEYSRDFLSVLEREINSMTESLLRAAVEGLAENPYSPEDEEILDEFIFSMKDRLKNSIANQMYLDVLNLMTTFNRFLIRVNVKASQNYTMEGALQSERRKLFSNIDLYRRDSLGRKRDSEQFVFTDLRFTFYRSFNIGMIFLLSKSGDARAQIVRPGHQTNGTIFDLIDFEDMEEKFFHPNAKALIVPM